MVIATATSRDGDDSFFLFFSGDASNVLVPMRARDVERREEGWTVLGVQDFVHLTLNMFWKPEEQT